MLATILVFAGLAYAYSALRTESWTTTASLGIQDPRSQQLSSTGAALDPERYLNDQVAILQSAEVAERAAQLASQAEPPFAVTTDEVLDHREVTASSGGSLVTIRYEAEDPDEAMAVANALATAYQEIYRQDAAAAFSVTIAEMDISLAALDEEIAVIRAAITEWTAADPLRSGLEQQYQEALDRLVELDQPRANATDREKEAYLVELDGILATFQTLQLAETLQPDNAELAALVQDEEGALARRSQLADRRDQLEIDAQLLSTGVVLYYPARFVTAAGINLMQTLLVGTALGALAGLGGAYFATLRNWRFGRRDEPEAILHAPLLAEVPNFAEERSRSVLPVRDAPASASAEAFRFAAATLEVRFSPVSAGAGPPPLTPTADDTRPRLFVVTSSTLGEGKTVVTANTAIAAARGGSRVLVIDGDLGRPALTRLMLRPVAPVRGLTDVVEKGLPLSRTVAVCKVSDAVQLDVLGRGTQHVTAADFWRSNAARELLEMAREEYDLVLVDSPPLLQEAYTSTLVGYADRVIIVVPHKSRVSLLEEELQRLALIGTPLAGYVYNRAPLRPEMVVGKKK